MAKRILDCAASDFARMTKEELLFAIGASEGRTLAAETIGTVTPLLGDVTNAELAAALGADILLLNLFDVDAPQLQGLPPDRHRHSRCTCSRTAFPPLYSSSKICRRGRIS